MRNVKPIANNLFVTPLEDVTNKHIVLPDSGKPLTTKGVVIDIGEDVRDILVGDKILFMTMGYKLVEDRELKCRYLIMDTKNVLAILEE